jgi:hypothetical protein
MLDTDEAELETAIRSALRERASSVAPSVRRVPESMSHRRSGWSRRVAAVLAAAIVTIAILVLVLVASEPGGREDGDRIRVTSPALTGFGAEAPLTVAPPPDATVGGMVRDAGGHVTDAHAVAVTVPDGTVITKWTAKVDGAPYRCVAGANSRACGGAQSPPPGTEIPENITELGDDTTTQLLWIDLPPGTAYTTFTRDGSSRWQRPVEGMSVFSLPAVNGTPVHFSALDATGRELRAFDYTSTNGVYIANWPPWWDLSATIRWCNDAPLIDVERKVNGGQGGRYRAFFPGAGFIDIDVRDACTQEAPLRPNPYGDIVAEGTLRNGRLAFKYYERADRTGGAKGAVIPEDEAMQRIARQRAELRTYCTTHPKEVNKPRGCERGA